jgi:hypothetical protein
VGHIPDRVDVLSQTYVYDVGKMYCRYAPGFPIVLAGWIGLFGDNGAHYLNPTVYVLFLLLLFAFQLRVFRSPWRAIAGTVMIAYFPNYMRWWAVTLVRDIPTHFFGILGLFLLLPVRGRRLGPARTALAAISLGYAASCRPDAILYVIPAFLLALARWEQETPTWGLVGRSLGTGVLGLLVGLTPLFVYNWKATGSPIRMTQGMEIAPLLPSMAPKTGEDAAPTPPVEPQPPAPTEGEKTGFPSPLWKGGTESAVQGGGLRLSNLPRVLPQNWGLLRRWYGDVVVGLAVWGAILAFFQRRMLFASGVIYTLLALLFYSIWAKADPRYQIGEYAFLPMLVVEGSIGTLDLVRNIARRRSIETARILAVGFVVAVLLGWWATDLSESLNTRDPVGAYLVQIITLTAVAGGIAAAFVPRARVARVTAAVLAGLLLALSCREAGVAMNTARARFQRPEMERARSTLNAAVDPKAVVITTEEVGRPAENIDYYSGVAHALYFTDLKRWRLSVSDAAKLLAQGGWVPYVLIWTEQKEPRRAEVVEELAPHFTMELVADIPARRAMDYFVASAAYSRGVHMELYRLKPLPG